MNRKYIYGFSFLFISLGIAYWASLPQEDQNRSNETVWKRLKVEQIQEISYQSDSEKVRVKRRSGDKFWITYEKIDRDKKEKAKPETFLASEKIAAVLELFEPLKVKRVIGKVAGEQLKDFSLSDEDPLTEFKIFGSNNSVILDFRIGKRSFGSRNYFVVDRLKNTVLLMSGARIEDLAKAKTRLYERKPYSADFAEIDAAQLNVSGKSKDFSRNKKDKNGALGWSDAGEKSTIKASYNAWMRKVQNLRVIRYPNAEEESSLESGSLVFELSFMTKNRIVAELSLLKSTGSDGKVSYWLKTDHLKSFAKVDTTRCEALEKDLPVILGEG